MEWGLKEGCCGGLVSKQHDEQQLAITAHFNILSPLKKVLYVL